jgi:hypothetical protein
MAKLEKQHVCINFDPPGEGCLETSEMMKVAFGGQTVGTTQVCEWFSQFKSIVIAVEDAQHPGC